MRLRDKFAALAMVAILSRASIAELEVTDGYSADECAQDAYIYAAAMMRERLKTSRRKKERKKIISTYKATRSK